MNERAAKREQLAHSAGQTASCDIAFALQIDQAQHTVHALLDFARGHAMRAGKEAKIFRHGEIAIEAEALRDITELRAHDVSLSPDIRARDPG